jgi:hypothetical protein
VGIRHLAKQDPGRGHELLKGQRTAHQQAGKLELREHHPVQKPSKDHRQAAEATLEQSKAQQAGERKSQRMVQR